jgi:CDP-glucose 4,6-dehydratase
VEGVAVSGRFWNGKRVLLTGHTGFKGSWLATWLQHLGAIVAGYALPSAPGASLFELASLAEQMEESVHADIRDLHSLSELIERFRPEVVFHLAAQSLVRVSYVQPVETYQVNVIGTVNVLEAVRKSNSCRAVVVVTSDKCYENSEWAWGYRESDPLGGHDPYSSSKGCAELVTAAYRRSFFQAADAMLSVGVASARAGNVIGGGDFSQDRLVPDVMTALLKRVPLKVRNPESVRPWQHVLEPLAGYLLLAERLWSEPGQYAQSWNFGPPQEGARPVHWLIERLIGYWGEAVDWERDARPAPHEAHLLMLDSAKARSALGWEPRWSLERALLAVVEWYKAYETGGSLRDVMTHQIVSYESTAYTGEMEAYGSGSLGNDTRPARNYGDESYQEPQSRPALTTRGARVRP